jgi:hypothetical protein
MAPNEVEPGDRVRYMQPTRVPGGFVDCSTVLVVCGPAQAYWTALEGRLRRPAGAERRARIVDWRRRSRRTDGEFVGSVWMVGAYSKPNTGVRKRSGVFI